MCVFSFIFAFSCLVAAALTQNISARNFNSDCGQVFTKREFIIESPGYPSNYPLNYQCSYLIKGPTCPTRFNLQLLDFSVEESLGCSKDRLEVEDKGALCGNRNNDSREYFSEKGTLIMRFVSDSDVSGRGYRILVTRSLCQVETPEEVTIRSVPKWYTTNKDVEYTTTPQYPSVSKNYGKCCQTSYRSKQFILTSPNFPYSMSNPAECLYEIYKSNVNICRLRIHVQFFWLGRSTNDCSQGFLEIDGKRICGCKSDLKIIAPFEGKSIKSLHFVSKGYERSSYSGFVMDVIQDECPNKFVPESQKNITVEKNFRFYNDQINRVSWPNKSHVAVIEKLHLISENTEIIADDENSTDEKAQPQVIRQVYFYSFPDYDRIPRDREETEYFDTSSRTSFEQDNTDYNYCQYWNQLQFNSLSLRNLPVCKTNEGSAVERKCIDLNQVRGYFKSPGYPFYYPRNMNACYRFHKLPGYCSTRVYMKDFDLQNSDTCENDYLLFANQLRYCGSRLTNTMSTLTLRDKPYEQMNFVTDAFYCGRGFFGTYEQIPCQEFPDPSNPSQPPSIPPYVPPPMMTPCSRTVGEKMFTFEVYDYNEPSCSLIIRKYTEYVCSVRLYFENFDLICASESLVADGTMYCGRLTGQSIKIDATKGNPVLTYRRSSNAGVNGLRLRIKGVQISEDCPYPEVPAERFLSPKLFNSIDSENSTMFLLTMGNKFKTICGVITNTRNSTLPETFCDLIMKNDNNVRNCLPLTENSLIVPIESRKIELKVKDAAQTEEIEFQEVDCDDVASQ